MLATILYILKIIGIVLLCILGFILVVVLLVLLCPWKYCIDVSKEAQLAGRVRISWLFYFLIADVLYQEGVNIRLRVLGIVVYDQQRRERKAAEKAEKEAAKKNKKRRQPQLTAAGTSEDSDQKSSEESYNPKGVQVTKVEQSFTEKLNSTEKPNSTEGQDPKERTDVKEQDSQDGQKKKKHRVWWEFPQFFFELIIDWIEKAVDFLFRLPDILNDWAEHLEEKIEDLIDKYDYYTNLLQKKGSIWVLSFLKNEIFAILKHICPKRSKINIAYANEDPAAVANMMAYYGMAMPFLPRHTTFTAELGESKLEGTIKVKGRIFLVFILWHGLKVFFNRKVRMFIKLLKREEE